MLSVYYVHLLRRLLRFVALDQRSAALIALTATTSNKTRSSSAPGRSRFYRARCGCRTKADMTATKASVITTATRSLRVLFQGVGDNRI